MKNHVTITGDCFHIRLLFKNSKLYSMAEIYLFGCKRCGWTCESPSGGVDQLMSGGMASYMCSGCKKIVTLYEEGDPLYLTRTKCPDCGGRIYRWSQQFCPECGGEMENKGLWALED